MTVRILTRVNSSTLTLPELEGFVGRDVEIVVRDRTNPYANAKSPVTEADWDALLQRLPPDILEPAVLEEYRAYEAEQLGRHWDGPR